MLGIIVIVLFVLLVLSVTVQLIEKKGRDKRLKPSGVKVERKINWFSESIDADRFMNAYRGELEENDEYLLPAKELKEYHEGEKVYKYLPLKLPMKMEEGEVYSYIDEDEWIKIGKLKKNADLDGELTLYLYPNTYKYVTEDSVEKESGDNYFGVEVKKVTHDPKI